MLKSKWCRLINSDRTGKRGSVGTTKLVSRRNRRLLLYCADNHRSGPNRTTSMCRYEPQVKINRVNRNFSQINFLGFQFCNCYPLQLTDSSHYSLYMKHNLMLFVKFDQKNGNLNLVRWNEKD